MSVEDVISCILPHLPNGEEDIRRGTGDADFIIPTICHGGDSHKLYYYHSSRTFHCYTQCSANYDIFSLLAKIKSSSDVEQLKFVQNTCGIGMGFGVADNQAYVKSRDHDELLKQFNSDDYSKLEKADIFKKLMESGMKMIVDEHEAKENYYSKKEKTLLEMIHVKELPEEVLTKYPRILHGDWKTEGITKEVADHFGVRLDVVSNAIVMPHRDWLRGKVIGVRRRALDEEEIANYGKYAPHYDRGLRKPLAHKLGYNFYGLYENMDAIRRRGVAYIFEGEKSVLKYGSEAGQENNVAIATCGFTITDEQLTILSTLYLPEVVLCFDKEYTNMKELGNYVAKMRNLKARIMNVCPATKVSIKADNLGLIGHKDSPIDRGLQAFEAMSEIVFPAPKNGGKRRLENFEKEYIRDNGWKAWEKRFRSSYWGAWGEYTRRFEPHFVCNVTDAYGRTEEKWFPINGTD